MMQLFDLGSTEYRLKAPIRIVIEKYPSEDNICARFSEINAFGEGNTESGAIAGLRQDIIDMYEDLGSKNGADLGGDLLAAWKVLQQVCERKTEIDSGASGP